MSSSTSATSPEEAYGDRFDRQVTQSAYHGDSGRLIKRPNHQSFCVNSLWELECEGPAHIGFRTLLGIVEGTHACTLAPQQNIWVTFGHKQRSSSDFIRDDRVRCPW